MSRLRYCLPVWGSEFIRLSEHEPSSTIAHELQIIQNDTLRTITGNRRSDHVRIQDMLADTKMLSINQLAAYGTLLETWKARAFGVPHLSTLLHSPSRKDDRRLRSDSSNNLQAAVIEPFSVCAERLWNLTSDRFRETNLLSVAKIEAKKAVSHLPI